MVSENLYKKGMNSTKRLVPHKQYSVLTIQMLHVPRQLLINRGT